MLLDQGTDMCPSQALLCRLSQCSRELVNGVAVAGLAWHGFWHCLRVAVQLRGAQLLEDAEQLRSRIVG